VEVGIDVGGTHTRIGVAERGVVRHRTDCLTSEWLFGTLFSDEANAARLLALVPGEVIGRDDVALVVGANGCDTTSQCYLLTSWLGRYHPGPRLVLNDSELFGPALGLDAAISVVCGTGSIVVGRDRTGALRKVGGHGWLLGDPGAAPSLVRESVVAILQAHDAGADPGVLARSLMAHYGSADVVQLGYDVTADAQATHWGALAPLVFDAADQGDALATGIIEADAAALAVDVRRLHEAGVDAADIVLGGGVVTTQPRLEQALRRALAAQVPAARIHVLRQPPVLGALALAQDIHDHLIIHR